MNLEAPTRVFSFNPLTDPRWPAFVERDPHSSLFHTRSWLGALEKTYGYEPVAYTDAKPEEDLQAAVVLCRVSSWLTGRRWVALPFSDHCDLLGDDTERLGTILRHACQTERSLGFQKGELRTSHPAAWTLSDAKPGTEFYFHKLSLAPGIAELRAACHKDSIQRKLRRAEREGLRYEEDTSDRGLASFYRLFVVTRRRHGWPPPPRAWFRHLRSAFGDDFKIRFAVHQDNRIAAMLTLRHRDTMVFKYGCSDEQFHPLGGVPMLFWRAIEEAKNDGLAWFDLGRSDKEDTGLVTFKDRLGAERSELFYMHVGESRTAGRKLRVGRSFFRRLPGAALEVIGRAIYPHVG